MSNEVARTTNHTPRIRVHMDQVAGKWKVVLRVGHTWRYLHPSEAHAVADKLHDVAEKVEVRNIDRWTPGGVGERLTRTRAPVQG